MDKIVHGHGEPLIDFMQDAKLCVLNDRLNPENDNYTCISPRGASVVDYIITPHVVYYKCPTFNFYTMTERWTSLIFRCWLIIDVNLLTTQNCMYILYMKQLREVEMNDSTYIENSKLDCSVSYDEVEKIVNKRKLNKSGGINQIPNEVLKNHDVMLMLYHLFIKCFDYGLIPWIWMA